MTSYEPIRYNASNIKTFSSCEFRHYYKEFVPLSHRKLIQENKEKKGGALPSHVGNIFHNVVDIIHKQYIGEFPCPLWSNVEDTLDKEWKRYKQKHIEGCLKNSGKITLKDEHKTVALSLLKEYAEVFWASPLEKVVASELKCRWSDIEMQRKLLNLPRGDRASRQQFYNRYGVVFDDVMVTLVGAIDYIYKSPDHRRIGICDFKTVYSSNRKEVERQFASQIESTRFQLGVYATIIPHWINPEVMLEGVLCEASVRLISPLGVQQRTFNKDEVQQAKDHVRHKLAALIQLRKKHTLNPEKWVQSKNFACNGCEAFGVCKTANPNAKDLIPSPEWNEMNQKQIDKAVIEKAS
jgi:hypothetical protein